MKYYFVSDLHGCELSLLKTCLAIKDFNSETDTLVVVGDIVDRGLHTMDLIKYLLSLPHTIFIYGNHDCRTHDVICHLGHHPDLYDKHNGVAATLHSIAGLTEKDPIQNIWYYLNVIFPGNLTVKQNISLFLEYYSKCVWAVEFNDLIVTHGWLPYIQYRDENNIVHTHLIRSLNDLSNLHKSYWYEATWANTLDCINKKLFVEKPMLVGHWWAADIRARCIQHKLLDDVCKDGTVDFSPVEYNNVTFIDPCVVASQFINVVVKEFDDEPFVYHTKADGNVVKARISDE